MKIVYVDGFKIRCTLDPDFGIIETRSTSGFSPAFYIPEGEVWIDAPFRAEAEFLMKVENFKEDSELPYPELRKKLKEELTEKGEIPNFVLRTEKQDGLKVCYVDGSVVRRFIDPEFIFGGHHLVYDYVPDGEIWIDDLQNPDEAPYTLLHERTEYKLMREGLTYDSAHDIATAFEKYQRRADGVGCYPGDFSDTGLPQNYAVAK